LSAIKVTGPYFTEGSQQTFRGTSSTNLDLHLHLHLDVLQHCILV
jgi:hypothetical protein